VILVDASRGVPKAGVCTEPLARDYATLPFGLLKRAIWPQMNDQLALLPQLADILRVIRHVSEAPKADIGRYLAIRQPNSTTAAPTAAAMTDVTIPPLSASSPPM